MRISDWSSDVCSSDLQEMIERHIEAGAEISVATIPVNAKDATSFGILKSDDEGNITSFTEKPSTDKLAGWESDVSSEMQAEGRVYLASMDIYVFNKATMARLLSEHQGLDFGKELIPASLDAYKMHN